jgi:hypothetical protein
MVVLEDFSLFGRRSITPVSPSIFSKPVFEQQKNISPFFSYIARPIG